MSVKYVVCDVDNTLLDTLSRLEEIVPSYKTSEQFDYRLAGDQLLPFIDASVYEGVEYSAAVVLILAQLFSEGYTPVYISETMSEEARTAKRKAVNNLHILLDKKDGAATFLSYEEEIDKFLNSLEKNKFETIFIDDAPSRLELFMSRFPDSTIYKMDYPYNKEYSGGKIIGTPSNYILKKFKKA